MVFLTKVKSEHRDGDMSSQASNAYIQLKSTDLSAMLFKDTSKTPAQLERDAGFCSGGSEIGDDYQSERQQDSPSTTDISDDSVDIRLSTIVIPNNQRKSLSTQQSENDIPLKKRIRYEAAFDIVKTGQPIIPTQNILNQSNEYHPRISVDLLHTSDIPNEAEILARHPAVTTLHSVSPEHNANDSRSQDQPLALVTRKPYDDNKSTPKSKCARKRSMSARNHKSEVTIDQENELNANATEETPEPIQITTNCLSPKSKATNQRNYKNMTRERRIEANARERTRVHTISAAFDTLRQSIPSYSNTQKLSKLSVLRVACAYILTLGRMAGDDYSADQSQPSLSSCMEEITKTIQTEGKSRKRKDE